MPTRSYVRYHALRACALVLLAGIALTGCENSVEPQLTDGELIRMVLEQGGDESILFSTSVLSDQTGTDVFDRRIDSVHRGFVNRRFYDETVDDPGALAFEALVWDTAFGTLTFRVEGRLVTRPFAPMTYGGNAKLLKNACFSCTNPWRIWRMQRRHAQQPSGDGSPAISSMTVTYNADTRSVATSVNVRIFRDSVLTMPVDSLSDVTVTVQTGTPDDSFFVTYPVVGGHRTRVMMHTDQTHTATVQVESSRRYELLAVQGFKRQALTDSTYVQATSTAIQTAILAFR